MSVPTIVEDERRNSRRTAAKILAVSLIGGIVPVVGLATPAQAVGCVNSNYNVNKVFGDATTFYSSAGCAATNAQKMNTSVDNLLGHYFIPGDSWYASSIGWVYGITTTLDGRRIIGDTADGRACKVQVMNNNQTALIGH